MQTRGTFPELYSNDLPRSRPMAEKKNGGKSDDEGLAELAERLGLRDHEGNLDLEAAKRTRDGAAPTTAAPKK
jgi:hypothetical protein